MPRSFKLLLGAGTVVPLALTGYLLVRVLGFFVGLHGSGGVVAPSRLADVFQELLTVQVTTVACFVALLCVYLWHLLVHRARRERIEQEPLLWGLALLTLPMVAMPIYWCTRVWPEAEPEQRRTRGA